VYALSQGQEKGELLLTVPLASPRHMTSLLFLCRRRIQQNHNLTHHVQCVPVARQWPEYCDRCKAKNVICTPNARSEGRPWSTPTAIAPTLTSDHNGSVEEDTADDQESGEKRNRDSSTATTRTRENFGTFEAQGHLEITTSRSEDRSQNQRSESSETHPDRISTAHPGISHVDSTAKPNSRLASTSDVNDGSSYFTDLYERNSHDICNLKQN